MSFIHKTTCRICKGGDLELILSLGLQPPVDNFTDAAHIENEKRYPLDVYFCKQCNLVQLLDVVTAEELFHQEYAYFSSASAPLVKHFETYAESLKMNFLQNDDLIVDIGSNDGVLLQFLSDYRTLGVEPSDNVANTARGKGIDTITEFFTVALAEKIVSKYGKAKVITANNVFAHIDDVDEIIRAIQVLMADDGIYVFEAHYLLDLIEKKEFDTVYHEHLCYYSVKPLIELFKRFDMEVFDVERVNAHGGSIRVFVARSGARNISPHVTRLFALEESAGLHDLDRFKGFQKEVEEIRQKLIMLVRGFRSQGKRVIGYGAPAKGNTLLNFCEFTSNDLEYITDTTPQKIGLLTPGSHIPVRSPDVLKTDTPDYIFLLAWNYKDFILQKEVELRQRGAKFIIPVPHVEVI
jgi:hypothetical protein